MNTINKYMRKLVMGCGAAAAMLFLAACQGDWDEPTNNPYGNNSINDENIITIQQLVNNYFSGSGLDKKESVNDVNYKIDSDIKIKGRVTGNDLGGNLYKQFVLQDSTAAIIIAVNQSGMNGFLPEGQEIVVALKDLYIGLYRKQPEIGQPYNGSSIGRMNKDLFQQHYKYVGAPDASVIKPIEFTPEELKAYMGKDNIYYPFMFANCAKLVKLKNVSFEPVGGLGTFAPDTAVDKTVSIVGGCVNRKLVEFKETELVVRTSTYARFAANKLPYDEVNKKPRKCNLTGIATRFNNVWQLLIRKESDIEVIE